MTAVVDTEAAAQPGPVQPLRRDGGGMLLADLISVERFNLVLHSAHDKAASIVALGAHSIEIAEPTRWLSPGWVIITTGMRLRGNAQAQRELVAEMVQHGMAALGYASGVQTRGVPDALVDEGERLGLPVFEIPLQTAVVEVIDHVRRHALRSDPEFMQQLVDLHAHLMGTTDSDNVSDEVAGQRPETALMRRLDVLVGAQVELVDEAGTLMWPHSGRLPRQQIALLDHAALDDVVELATDDGDVTTAFPIAYGQRRFGWILARWADGAGPSTDVPLIKAATNLASYARGAQELSPRHLSTLQRELTVRLLQGPPHSAELVERAGLLGFIEGEQRRLVLLTGGASEHGWAELCRGLDYMRVPYLATQVEAGTIAFIQASDDTLRQLVSTPSAGGIYLGCPVDNLAGFNRAYETALFVRSAHRSAGDVAWWDDLPLSAWMVSAVDPDEGARRAHRLLDPLAEQPLLLDALVAYLEHDQSVSDAARALFLHPNSLRYRLTRVERLVGGTLHQPAVIADLYSALVHTGRLQP